MVWSAAQNTKPPSRSETRVQRAAPLPELLAAYRRRHPDEPDAARLERFLVRQPRCFERDCFDDGHVTGSAWIVDATATRVLLTHHRKLGRWLQPGGHSDGNPDTLAVAHREAEEESGLAVRPVDGRVLDVDIHTFPARGADPAHLHYDVRFAFVVAGSDRFRVGPESVDLAWIDADALPGLTDEESVVRMARKFALRSGKG